MWQEYKFVLSDYHVASLGAYPWLHSEKENGACLTVIEFQIQALSSMGMLNVTFLCNLIA